MGDYECERDTLELCKFGHIFGYSVQTFDQMRRKSELSQLLGECCLGGLQQFNMARRIGFRGCSLTISVHIRTILLRKFLIAAYYYLHSPQDEQRLRGIKNKVLPLKTKPFAYCVGALPLLARSCA